MESSFTGYATLTDNGNGTYGAAFTPSITGTYQLTLAVNNVNVLPVPTDPFTSLAVISLVGSVAANCVAQGAGASGATAGQANYFIIQARDVNNQAKNYGGDRFDVSIVPTTATNEYGRLLTSYAPTAVDQALLASVDALAIPGQYNVSYTIPDFGVYNLSISLRGSGPIGGSPYTLFVGKQLPPVTTMATFSSTATQLLLAFADPVSGIAYATNRGGLTAPASCSLFLSNATTALLGNSPSCDFSDDYTLVVTMGFGATIAPNDNVVLLPTSITNKNSNSAYATGTAVVIRPTTAPTPTLVVRAPVYLSVCEDFTLDASGR